MSLSDAAMKRVAEKLKAELEGNAALAVELQRDLPKHSGKTLIERAMEIARLSMTSYEMAATHAANSGDYDQEHALLLKANRYARARRLMRRRLSRDYPASSAIWR